MVTRVAAHVTVEAVVLVAASDIESVIEILQQCQLAGATVTMQTQKPPSRQSQAVANAQAERAVAAHGLLQATPTVGALAQPAPELQIAPARSASPCVGDAASQIYSVFIGTLHGNWRPTQRARCRAVCATLDADSPLRMTQHIRRLLARPSIILLSPLQIEMRHYYAISLLATRCIATHYTVTLELFSPVMRCR